MEAHIVWTEWSLMSIKKAADEVEPQEEGQLKGLWEVIEDGGPCKDGAEGIPISLQ